MRFLPATFLTSLLAAVLALGATLPVAAQDTQRNYRLDTTFNPVAENTVYAFAVQPDGKVIVGGAFSEFNHAPNNGVARLNADGSLDASFHSALPFAEVVALALQADGKIVVGGYFGTGGSPSSGNIARLNPDGSLDGGFHASTDGGDFDVLYVIAQPDGKTIISGRFATVNGTAVASGFCRLNADGSLDTAYTARAGAVLGADSLAPAIGLQTDGKLILDVFTDTGYHLLRLNTDGGLDPTYHADIISSQSFGGVENITLQTDGKALINGGFAGINGVQQSLLARLNKDGSLDTAFTPAISEPTSYLGVNSVAVQPDGKIVVGGQFAQVNGVAARNLARLRADGTFDPSFIANVTAPNASGDAVWVVGLQADGSVLVGGDFEAVNDAPHANVARLNADPTITIEALNGNISDADLAQGSFRLNRTGDALGSLTVNFLIRGGALNGTDYTIKNVEAAATTGKKKLKAGKFSKPIHVTPLNTGDGSGNLKGVKIKLAPGDGYIVGEPAVAKFKIIDQP